MRPLPRLKIGPQLTDHAKEVLQSIALKYGHDMLMDGYSKLLRAVYCLQRYEQPEGSTHTLFEIFVESCLMSVAREQSRVDFFKTNNIGGESKKDSKPGFADLVAARASTLGAIQSFLKQVSRDAARAELLLVWKNFESPLSYHKQFPVVDPNATVQDGDEVVKTPMQIFCKGKTKIAVQLATLGEAL